MRNTRGGEEMDRSKPDHFSIKAKQAGFPARSVFKLQEIDRKYKVLKSGDRVLDIGAAPGSWSMWAAQRVGKGGSVIGVDLKDFRLPGGYSNVTTLTGDAFSAEIQKEIGRHGPFDVILSDAAPATTGNRTVDTARSGALAEECIRCASTLLRSGGKLVFKLFQGGEEQQLMQQLRQLFRNVKTFKPRSSRKDSFELFFIADGFRSPEPGPESAGET